MIREIYEFIKNGYWYIGDCINYYFFTNYYYLGIEWKEHCTFHGIP